MINNIFRHINLNGCFQDQLNGVEVSEKQNEATRSKQYSEGNQTLVNEVLNRAQGKRKITIVIRKITENASKAIKSN